MAMTKEQLNAYKREWNKKNKEKKRESDRKYRESHKEEIKAYHKGWRDENRERLNEKSRARYKENPQSFKARTDKYRESHQERVRESRRRYKEKTRKQNTDYERGRRHNDPIHRFRSSVVCLIRGYARKKGYKGDKTTWELIGCDFDTFLSHIQSQFEDGMTMENYGHGEGMWNVDHIVPYCTAETDDDVERLNHYTNLRPMWAKDNYRRPRKML